MSALSWGPEGAATAEEFPADVSPERQAPFRSRTCSSSTPSMLFDASRAPAGKHTAWAYCHVSNGSDVDMTERVEAQIERFAPGFRDRILARSTRAAVQYEQYDPTYVGGDILGGLNTLRQLLLRPAPRLVPCATPLRGVYLCSAATPPGGGVHGMCGFFAAQAVLRALR